jgi:hypothetical protein
MSAKPWYRRRDAASSARLTSAFRAEELAGLRLATRARVIRVSSGCW